MNPPRSQLGYTVLEVARYVGVTPRTVKSWLAGDVGGKKLDRIKVGGSVRIPKVALDRFIGRRVPKARRSHVSRARARAVGLI